VRVDGERISRRPEEERADVRARRIGVLFQQTNLVGHLSVADNVALAQRLAGHDDPARRAEVLERCGIAGRAHGRPAQLSGGELARAGLAVALANDPSVILADEPTGELDTVTGERVLDLLRDRAAEGAAVLVVTHSSAVAGAADREIRLRDGRVAS
jgi:putative ABC transport system ATP-binding protein